MASRDLVVALPGEQIVHGRARTAAHNNIATDYPQYLRSLKEHPHKSPHSRAEGGFSEGIIACMSMKNLVPQVGFKPTTLRLTSRPGCSRLAL